MRVAKIMWAVLAVAVLALPSPAALALENAVLNRSVALGMAAPRYDALAEATAALEKASASYCRKPAEAGFASVQNAYTAAMDAWMAAQIFRLGPITLQNRSDRIQYWPDKHNTATKQFADAMQKSDPRIVAGVAAGTASVALQGLPAFERLLFDPDARPGDAAVPTGTFRCDLLAAIATNLKKIAADTRKEWGDDGKGFAKAVLSPGGDNPYFASDAEATTAFLTSYLTQLQIIKDDKLLHPLGKDLDAARPTLCESWRSARSLRNIEANLRTLRTMYDGAGPDQPGFAAALLDTPDGQGIHALIDESFDKAFAAIGAIGMPVEQAMTDPQKRPMVELLLARVRTVQAVSAKFLPGALGVTIGFNFLDGD